MEYQFTFTVYPLTETQAADLREKLQDLILEHCELSGLFMGPLVAEEVQDGKGETD